MVSISLPVGVRVSIPRFKDAHSGLLLVHGLADRHKFRDRAGEPIDLGHHKHTALADKFSGERLHDSDLAFLEEVFADTRQVKPFLDGYPQYHELAARMVNLYKEITDKALENEKRHQPGK